MRTLLLFTLLCVCALGVTAQTATYTNPVLWEDLADNDVIRVNDTFYYSASTMAYSPGAPVLRSYDLVNWEYIGHSVPVLDFGSNYDLSGNSRAYVAGVWASFFKYRPSNKLYYWGGCISGSGRTYIYTASAPEGPYTKHGPLPCYYDAGMLVDDDDTLYVAFGGTTISVAQLSKDGFSEVKSQNVFNYNNVYLEGSRFYKRNGYYYIFNTRPANGQFIARAKNVWGPYTVQNVLDNMRTPVPNSGIPHQGSLIDTPSGDWYYMAFIDNYPGGRTPVLAPVTWVNDWPVITTVNGGWGLNYPMPNLPGAAAHPIKPMTGTDYFTGSALGPEWEFNHNPDTTKFTVGAGLVLSTATVTQDFFQARNTLTHRILGPQSAATIVLNFTAMKDGDRTGLALFRDHSAYIGLQKDSGAVKLVFVDALDLGGNGWQSQQPVGGRVEKTVALPAGTTRIFLQLDVDIHPGTGKQGKFAYSLDGAQFTQLGAYTMTNDWSYFIGYRFGVFNFATQALGGAVTIESFTLLPSGAPAPDPCASVNCGAHGRCSSGACVCADGYTGPTCNIAPSPTPSTAPAPQPSTGPAPAPTTICATASEGGQAALSCPAGKTITAITFASYGLPSGSCPSFTAGSCHASSSVAQVQSACVGKSSCSVAASNNVFGDPCSGRGKTLDIAAQCS